MNRDNRMRTREKDPISSLAEPRDQFRVRLASVFEDVQSAQNLRFAVQALELGPDCDYSYTAGSQDERYDEVCHHILVEDVDTKAIIGTCRLQTGLMALGNWDYQCAQLFDCEPFEPFRRQIIETGRLCVRKDHRTPLVFGLLWRGVVSYAEQHDIRYLISTQALASQSAAVGAAIYSRLSRDHLAPTEWRTKPWPAFACPLQAAAADVARIDELLADYLASGTKVCAPPAINRYFGTIEFLTMFDLHAAF